MVDEAEAGLALLREAIEVGRGVEAAPEVVRGYINIGSRVSIRMDRLAEAEKYRRAGLDYAVLFPASAAAPSTGAASSSPASCCGRAGGRSPRR